MSKKCFKNCMNCIRHLRINPHFQALKNTIIYFCTYNNNKNCMNCMYVYKRGVI